MNSYAKSVVSPPPAAPATGATEYSRTGKNALVITHVPGPPVARNEGQNTSRRTLAEPHRNSSTAAILGARRDTKKTESRSTIRYMGSLFSRPIIERLKAWLGLEEASVQMAEVELLPVQQTPARIQGVQHPPFAERHYLTLHELANTKIMRVGKAAENASGLVHSHIDALKELAKDIDSAISIRKVNPYSARLIISGMPVKDLSKKTKTEKGGPAAGLMVRDRGLNDDPDSNIGELDGAAYSSFLKDLIDTGEVFVVPDEDVPAHETGEHRQQSRSVILRDPERGLYKVIYDLENKKFSLYKQSDSGEFWRMRFEGYAGQPITADYDAFDFYPRLTDKNFAGFKDIDTSALKDSRGVERFRALVNIVMEQVLELPEVRKTKGKRGRLTAWDNYIIDMANARIKERTGHPHDLFMHGKEKRNTQYPELCNEVFFIFPDGTTLMSTTWEQAQAVDYAIQQEGFISTNNRVYNEKAGEKALFPDQRQRGADGSFLFESGSGKTIPWDSRAAAEKLYKQYSRRSSTSGAITLRPSPRRDSSISLASVSSVASIAPDWLQKLVEEQDFDSEVAFLDGLRQNNPHSRVAGGGTQDADRRSVKGGKSIPRRSLDGTSLAPLTKTAG